MLDLQVITIFEEGEPLIDGEPGDLKFVLKTAVDSKYVRQKDDLWYYQTISLEQALVGFAIQVRTQHFLLFGLLISVGRQSKIASLAQLEELRILKSFQVCCRQVEAT